MKQWREERCARRPDELQAVAPGLYIQRRNIREVEHAADGTAGTDAYTDYVCESRDVTEDEYAMLVQADGQDEVFADILLNQMDILANQEAQDAAIADILLNQVETEAQEV